MAPRARSPSSGLPPKCCGSTHPPLTRSCLSPVTGAAAVPTPGLSPGRVAAGSLACPPRPLVTAHRTQALPLTASGHSELSQGSPLLWGQRAVWRTRDGLEGTQGDPGTRLSLSEPCRGWCRAAGQGPAGMRGVACREMPLSLSLEHLGAFVGGSTGLISCCHAAGDGEAWGEEAGWVGRRSAVRTQAHPSIKVAG